MKTLEDLRYCYFIEQGVTEDVARRKAKEQCGKVIRLPLNSKTLAIKKDVIQAEVNAAKISVKKLSKRGKPLKSLLRWAEMVTEYFDEFIETYGELLKEKEA